MAARNWDDTGLNDGDTISTTEWEDMAQNNIIPNSSFRTADNIEDKGLTITQTAGEALSAGDLTYLNSDGFMWKADASAETTTDTLLAVATTSLSASTSGDFLLFGTYTTSGLTTGSVYYVSTTSGEWTTTAPSTTGEIVRIIGYALATTTLYFKPSGAYVEV